MHNSIKTQIENSVETKQKILADEAFLQTLQTACQLAADAFRQGKKILIAGNGGSAADAQHIAGELVSRFYFDRPGLPAIALNTDTSILTGVGNDYGYEQVFSRQIEAHGQAGDIFIAISTSGNSANILRAITAARSRRLLVIGFTGETGGKMAELCDYIFRVPSRDTPRIQESHILLGHILCALVEETLFASEYKKS